jgi:chaperonin GroES
MTIQPLHDVVIVRHPEEQEKIGSLYIPQSARPAPQTAIVVAAGPGALSGAGVLVPTTVKPGDVVLTSKWGGHEIEVEGEKLYVLRETELVGIVRE